MIAAICAFHDGVSDWRKRWTGRAAAWASSPG